MNDIPSTAAPPSADHVDALPLGTRLGEFEILGLLGVGGFGMVYRAFDYSLRRHVAIKEYMPTALAGRLEGSTLRVRTSSDIPTFQAGLMSFMEEARLLARFDHPSLVKVFRFWEANNTAYMVMPLYQGMTLKQARALMRKPPAEAWLRKVLWAVLGALRVLHSNQMLHRDISPDNIFLQDVGPPVLLDLGAARRAISDTQHQNTAILKVNYAPIEQYSVGEHPEGVILPQGPWTDLYALAAVVHGCLCNDAPLPATLRMIRDRMVRFSRVTQTIQEQFGLEYSAAFITAVSQALELQPEQRPQSIDEFLALMEMTAPPEGLQQFNWRTDLGASWDAVHSVSPDLDANAEAPTRFMEPPKPTARPHTPPSTAVDMEVTRAAAPPPTAALLVTEVASRAAHTTSPPPVVFVQEPRPVERPRIAERTAMARSGMTLITLAGVVIGATLWWGLRPAPSRPPTPESQVITEWADPQKPASAATPAAQPAPAPPPVTEPTSAPAVAVAEPASTPASLPAPPPLRRLAAARAKALESTQPPPSDRPTAPVPMPEPAPAPQIEPPRPAPRSPLQACADATFLGRPLCIHNECQKPEFVNYPVCVEARRRYEAEEQRRRNLGQ